jgi:hypothetical protein
VVALPRRSEWLDSPSPEKWVDRTPTPREQRRAQVDAAVAEAFGKARGLHGSPRLHADLRDAGWTVSDKTVAYSMRRLLPNRWPSAEPVTVVCAVSRRSSGSPRR